MAILLSIILFFTTLVLIFLVIWWLPADYFVSNNSHLSSLPQNPTLSKILFLVRNIIGVILIILGIIMLILPGQGVLTIVIGLILVDFPKKKEFLNKLVALKSVQKSLNYLRKKMNKEPFVFPKN